MNIRLQLNNYFLEIANSTNKQYIIMQNLYPAKGYFVSYTRNTLNSVKKPLGAGHKKI